METIVTPDGLDRPARPAPAGAPLRVAIVGAGKMGQHHARAVARVPGLARVAAVVDLVAAAREAMLRIAPGSATYDDLAVLLAAGQIDVVHVCTSPETHERIAEQALEAGCHVYVEKPFVESVAAADRLIALARAKGLQLCAGHQLLYETPARRALDLLPALGNVVHVESYFSFRTVRRAPGGRAPLRADLQLLDILPHPVYLLLHVLEAMTPESRTELTALEVGPAGTVHALVRRGGLTGTLTVTLEGRPVESYLRLVGTNGLVHADFVRGTVQRQLGPGTSGIDKALSPFRLARQLLTGTTAALGRRVAKRQRSYPGLAEIFEAFYRAIQGAAPPAVSTESIRETVRIWEEVTAALRRAPRPVAAPAADPTAPRAVVTGGTGFLGRELVRALGERGAPVRVLARRQPPPWEQLPGVEYTVADVAQPLPDGVVRGADVVIHCAAETAGGREEHQKNSIDATERVLRAAAAAGVRRVIHVSSLAVLAGDADGPVNEETPLEPRAAERGPYVWGKVESERLALRLGRELGLDVKVVRPGALVDYRHFEPPGRLGKRLGNVFVAVGSPRDQLGVADVSFAGRTLAWMAEHFDEAPATLNLLAPALPIRRELVARLRRSNPDLTVIWLPMAVLRPLSWLALGLQRILRPGATPIDLARVFASQPYDTSRVAALTRGMRDPAPDERSAEGA